MAEQLESTRQDYSSYIGFLTDEIQQQKLPPPEPPKAADRLPDEGQRGSA